MHTYHGSCHCGAVTYEVQADFTEGMRCNCSHCVRKGFLLTFVPEAQFTLQTGDDTLTKYQFNKKKIDHLFCKTCGVQSFGRGAGPNGEHMIAINLNCIDEIDTSTLQIHDVNGKDF